MIPIARPMIGPEEKQAILEVLDSGMLVQGSRVRAFEQGFAQICGTREAIATSSGTTALHVALLAHRVGPGDEVITPSFSFIATANTVVYVGAKPVFVDIDPQTFNIDPELIEQAITPQTKAIMPVHLFGLPANMDVITDLAQQYHLAIIEDACQAHGATYYGKPVGSFGTGCFSFYPTKNITTAEGGIITTDDPELAQTCRDIREHGMRRRYYHDSLGYNFRMTDVHAAIGCAQLKKLPMFNQARMDHAAYLSQHLKKVILPTVPENRTHVFHQYTIRVPEGRRDALAEGLRERGVGTQIYYPVPIHQQRIYLEMGYDVRLPETERAAKEVLSLPVHPSLDDSDLEFIVNAVNELT